MKKHIGNRFAKFVSLDLLTIIIINNSLNYNNQSTCNYYQKDFTTIYIVSHIIIYEICQDNSKIVKSKVKTETRLNFGGV